jgi:Flp pilus assembly protein CpaB
MPRRSVVVAATVASVMVAVLMWFAVGPDGGRDGSSVSGGAEPMVLRSTGMIAAGVSGEDLEALGLVESVAGTIEELPEFAVMSVESLAGMVTATDIGPGEVLAAGMFVSQATSMSGLANRLDVGHTALAVTVDSTRAVGGWLRPGDRVNILVPSSCPEGATLSSGVADGDVEVKCRRARYLYQAVAVLAVGAESVPVAADSGAVIPQPGAATLVLSLPPRAAQWVASYDNDLWFTLVHPQYQPRAIGPLPLLVDQLPGEDPALLTPECGDPADPVQAGNAASGVDGSGNQCVAPPALGLAP